MSDEDVMQAARTLAGALGVLMKEERATASHLVREVGDCRALVSPECAEGVRCCPYLLENRSHASLVEAVLSASPQPTGLEVKHSKRLKVKMRKRKRLRAMVRSSYARLRGLVVGEPAKKGGASDVGREEEEELGQ